MRGHRVRFVRLRTRTGTPRPGSGRRQRAPSPISQRKHDGAVCTRDVSMQRHRERAGPLLRCMIKFETRKHRDTGCRDTERQALTGPPSCASARESTAAQCACTMPSAHLLLRGGCTALRVGGLTALLRRLKGEAQRRKQQLGLLVRLRRSGDVDANAARRVELKV